MPTKKTSFVNYVPTGFQTLLPYLLVDDGTKMLNFLKKAFKAKEDHVSHDDNGKVRHATVEIYGSKLMMGQVGGDWKATPCSLYFYVRDCDAVQKAAIAAGATQIMPPTNQFYGDRHGGVIDPCGNQWWIATHLEDVSNNEIERRGKIARVSTKKRTRGRTGG
jgi:PhnB protein